MMVQRIFCDSVNSLSLSPKPQNMGFPKLRNTFLGVPTLRNLGIGVPLFRKTTTWTMSPEAKTFQNVVFGKRKLTAT